METLFSALVEMLEQFSALVETKTCFSALVGTKTRFSALVETKTHFSALVETETRFSAPVEGETHFLSLVETEACFSVRLLHLFCFLGGRLTSAGGACGGGGGMDSCGGCDAVSKAMGAAFALSGLGGCGNTLSRAICAASAVSGKCQRHGPVSSRQPERMGCPSGL